jgi:hypothetical protein
VCQLRAPPSGDRCLSASRCWAGVVCVHTPQLLHPALAPAQRGSLLHLTSLPRTLVFDVRPKEPTPPPHTVDSVPVTLTHAIPVAYLTPHVPDHPIQHRSRFAMVVSARP